MSDDVFCTMIVPAALAPLARALGAGLSTGGAGMFTTGLSASGSEPATHYVSSGMIGEQFAELTTDGVAMYLACKEAGATVTQAQCTTLVSKSVVSDGTLEVTDKDGVVTISSEGPHELIARLGLKLLSAAL